jgi:hypothetical protein
VQAYLFRGFLGVFCECGKCNWASQSRRCYHLSHRSRRLRHSITRPEISTGVLRGCSVRMCQIRSTVRPIANRAHSASAARQSTARALAPPDTFKRSRGSDSTRGEFAGGTSAPGHYETKLGGRSRGSIVGLLLRREPTFLPSLAQFHARGERRVSPEVRPPCKGACRPSAPGAMAGTRQPASERAGLMPPPGRGQCAEHRRLRRSRQLQIATSMRQLRQRRTLRSYSSCEVVLSNAFFAFSISSLKLDDSK